MTRSIRKLTITAHVVFSVGWLGAAAAFLALSIIGMTSQDAGVIRSAYWSMNVISKFVIVPMCFAALATGLFQALGTPWGLFRHYWIVAKFGIALFATIALLVHQFSVIAVAAKSASGASAETLAARLAPLRVELVRAPGLSILLLLTATALGIYKPWGMTAYGQRKQQARHGELQPVERKLPFGATIFLTILGVLMILFVLLHLTGHGFEGHGH